MAGDVQHDAPPFELRNIPDGECGYGKAAFRPVGVQYLHRTLPRVEEPLRSRRAQMQDASSSLPVFQAHFIALSRFCGLAFQGTQHVRGFPVPGHGESRDNALGIQNIQQGFHRSGVPAGGINGQAQRQAHGNGGVGPAFGRRGKQNVFRRDGSSSRGRQACRQSQNGAHPVKTFPGQPHSGFTFPEAEPFHPGKTKKARHDARAFFKTVICGRRTGPPDLRRGLSRRPGLLPFREGWASCRLSWPPSASSWRPFCPCRTSSCAFPKSS